MSHLTPTPEPLDADHKKDDYARTRVPATVKRGPASILSVLTGIVTAFFFLFLGGIFYENYGSTATWIGTTVGFILTTTLSWITCYFASKEGLTAELMTRGCGFGAMGGLLTTLIYGTTFVILSATEAQILASNIALIWDLPNIVWYVFVSAIFIPLVWGGIGQISKLLSWSIVIYLPLIVWAIWIAWHAPDSGSTMTAPEFSLANLPGILAIIGTLSAMVGLNPLESADYNRFISHKSYVRSSFITVILPFIFMFFVAIPLGMFFAKMTGSSNPGVYLVSLLGLLLGVTLSWVSQIRINLTNIHLGSIAFASISGQFGAYQLGRRFWTIMVSIAVVLLMVGDVLGNLTTFLEWNGIFLLAWVGCLIADLLIVRGLLKIVSGPIEYRSSHLYSCNPVGVVALLVATAIGSFVWLFYGESMLRSLAGYIAFGIALVVHVLMAVLTKGKYYTLPSPRSL